MSKLALRRLTRADGARMHAINRACPIEADFTFFFDREPEFFGWPDAVFESYVYVGGFRGEELVAYALFATAAGHAGPFGERHGYIGDGRVLPSARGTSFSQTVLDGLLEFEPPHAVSFALVKRGNKAAHAAIEKTAKLNVAGMGKALLCGFDAASVLLVRRCGGARRFSVRRAGDEDVPRLAELMQRAYDGRLFAPSVCPEEVRRDAGRLPGFGINSYWLAFDGTQLVGALGAWDADSVRRVTVLQLSLRAKLIRAAYEAARLGFRSAAPLPKPGQPFRAITTTRVAVPDGNPDVLRDLVATVHDEHLGRGYHMVLVGFTGDDPLAPALRGMLVQHFHSDVLAIAPLPNLDAILRERRPYVDLRFV